MQKLDLSIKEKGQYIKQGISYPGLMESRIKKSASTLQPLFEAFSNSLEATDGSNYEITIELCHKPHKDLFNNRLAFASLQIIDKGTGFTNESYDRFIRLFDKSKNKNNLGTGRIQFLHSFEYTQIESVYIESDGKIYKRRILLSLSFEQDHKAVICSTTPILVDDDSAISTSVAFFGIKSKDDEEKLNAMTCSEIKESILKRYLNKLCIERASIGSININHYIGDVFDSNTSETITSNDIPSPDYQEAFNINYSVLLEKGKGIGKSSEVESFEVNAYKLPSSILPRNEVRLTSKGESFIANGCDFALITESPKIEPHISYLFLISSDYLTNRDTDVRGNLNIYTRSQFLEKRNLFTGRKEILLDDIEMTVEDGIVKKYPAFGKIKQEAEDKIKALAKMFSIDNQSLIDSGVKSSDNASVALRKVYTYSANKKADNDAKIKEIYDSIADLDPSSKSYKRQFDRKVEELNKVLPLSIKEELSNYIARRSLVLTLMDNAVKGQLSVQNKHNSGKKKRTKQQPEAVFHNILFPKHSTSPIESNLWMLNDEYIHFEGLSEIPLHEVTINGKKLLKQNLSPEEAAYKLRNEKFDAGLKRPDVLLFPEEGRCIIIEFKAPGVDVSKHLHQINQYASLIHNLSDKTFKFNSFYGYLIGENADIYSIMDSDGDFQYSQSLGYIVRPHKGIPDLFGKGVASLYTEIIRFSDLLKRAKLRNKIFTDYLNR